MPGSLRWHTVHYAERTGISQAPAGGIETGGVHPQSSAFAKKMSCKSAASVDYHGTCSACRVRDE